MSFGEELRRERELREIGLREIAEATKVNFRQLQALEVNDFGKLPGGIFNRGMIRAYCQQLGIDADQMITAYLEEEQKQSGRSARRPGAHLLRGDRPPRAAADRAPALAGQLHANARWWLAAVLTLAVAAAAAGFWWLLVRPDAGSDVSSTTGIVLEERSR